MKIKTIRDAWIPLNEKASFCCNIIDDLCHTLRKTITNQEVGEAASQGSYSFIPMSSDVVWRIIKRAMSIHPRFFKDYDVFYDLGSGFGNILYIARELFKLKPIGIEKYLYFKNKPCLIEPLLFKDIIDLKSKDFRLHSNKDIPATYYLYNPLVKSNLMLKALENIMKHVPGGSLVIFVEASNTGWKQKPSCTSRIESAYYVHGAYILKIRP